MKIQAIALMLLLLIPIALAVDAPAATRLISISDVSPDTLSPGESSSMKITLDNNGDVAASNLVISWIEPTKTILSVGTGNTANVGNIAKDGSEEAEFEITTSAAALPGLYQIAITMTYDINGTPIVQEASAGIKVGGDTSFEIVVSDIAQNKVSLAISNIGKNPADSVTVQIPKQDGYEPIGTAAITLGKLAKSDYVVVPFNLQVKDSKSSLSVEISYTDTDGERKTVTEDIAFQPYQISVLTGANIPEKSNTGTIITIVVIILLAGAGIYFYRRYRKKKREEE